MGLWSDYLENDGRRTTKFNHYFPIYERHFAKFINTDATLFEIGVYQGGSLTLWKKYLGPHARIVGIDIDQRCRGAEEDQVSVRIGDQGDPIFLDSLVDEFGVPDIVIDDGSHQMRHMNATFDHLYPKLTRNSVYLVEDTHWCYFRESGVGTGENQSFIERTKSMIDLLHANYTQGRIQPTAFTHATSSIHVYDSVIVFEKQRLNKKACASGTAMFGEEIDNEAIVEMTMKWVAHDF